MWIGLGGFVGSVSRYLVTAALFHWTNARAFPFGTLTANLVGCLVIGALARLFEQGEYHANFRFFFVVGLLGGFTTFSSFSIEVHQLLRDGRFWEAASYVGISLFGGFALTALGWILVDRLPLRP